MDLSGTLTTAAVAAQLGVGRITVHREVQRGHLVPDYITPLGLLFEQSTIDAYRARILPAVPLS